MFVQFGKVESPPRKTGFAPPYILCSRRVVTDPQVTRGPATVSHLLLKMPALLSVSQNAKRKMWINFRVFF